LKIGAEEKIPGFVICETAGLLSLNCFLSLPETVLGSRMAHRKQKTRQAWIIREPVQPGFFLNPEAKYIYLWSLQRAATFAHHNKLSERRFLEDAARIFEETGSYRLAESLPPEWFQRSKNGHNTSHYRPRE
jgi:hypothetical protein